MKSAVITLAFISTIFGAAPAPSSDRIVGGTSTHIREYPYIGALLRFDLISWRLACAGSLITTRALLTASHCFYTTNDSSFWRVRLGSTYKSSGGQIHEASQLILHEDYDHSTVNNDVAILIMATSATLSDSVQLVSIPPPVYDIPDNQLVTLIGWGRLRKDGLETESGERSVTLGFTRADFGTTWGKIRITLSEFGTSPKIDMSYKQGGSTAEQLQHVDVNVINQQLCTDRYVYLSTIMTWPYKVNDGMICAGIIDVGGKDACQGDSGGPVSLKTADGHVVIGVVSWGYGCAHEFYPGVKARTSFYSDWIVRHASMQTS